MSSRNNPDWETKPRYIFAIIFGQQKSFYLNSTTQKNLWKVYDEHYRERHSCTKKLFAEAKNKELPSMFLLETMEGTKANAFQRCIFWSKYFVEKGYSCLAGQKMNEQITQFDANQDSFQSIIDIPIEKMCPAEGNLFPNFYQSKTKTPAKKANRENFVRFELVLHESEHMRFKKIADEYGISMTEFFLHCARHGDVIRVDMTSIDQYLHKIEDYVNTLDAIVASILLSRDYFPSYVERISDLCKDVIDSNETVKKEIIRVCRQIRRLNKQ